MEAAQHSYIALEIALRLRPRQRVAGPILRSHAISQASPSALAL